MNQKLSDWASIAEIISGIAVVITLLLVVSGINENTEVMRAAAFDRNMESINQWRAQLAQDEELLRIWQRRDQRVDLTEVERGRLNFLTFSLWGIYEKAFYAREYGTIGASEWSRFEVQICRQRDAMDPFYWENSDEFLSMRFIEYVETLCDVAG